MRTEKMVVAVATGLLLLVGTAWADWSVGDPYKYLQLPNPNGWDVSPHDPQDGNFTELADDWVCSGTGAISDIHLWYSWKGDTPHPFDIEVFIFSNVPAGPDPGGFSHPGDMLWGRLFFANQFTTRTYSTVGNQGWYEPSSGSYFQNNHHNTYQLNIENITTPFVQQQGTTYWLAVEMTGLNNDTIGWKTAIDQTNDAAVWLDTSVRANPTWRKLQDPITQAPLDLAFVLTPDPATLAMLVLGGLVVLRRQRG